MNKNEVKKFFWKVVSNLQDCADTITKNSAGVAVEVGMSINDDYCVMYGLDDGVIRIYNKDYFPIAAFTEENETLLILKELFDCVLEESTAPEVQVQEQPNVININTKLVIGENIDSESLIKNLQSFFHQMKAQQFGR